MTADRFFALVDTEENLCGDSLRLIGDPRAKVASERQEILPGVPALVGEMKHAAAFPIVEAFDAAEEVLELVRLQGGESSAGEAGELEGIENGGGPGDADRFRIGGWFRVVTPIRG